MVSASYSPALVLISLCVAILASYTALDLSGRIATARRRTVYLWIGGGALARLLGLDRPADFPPSRFSFTEAEEPEVLLAIEAPGLQAVPADPATWLADAFWQGMPSQVDPAPGYRWPVIAQVT